MRLVPGIGACLNVREGVVTLLDYLLLLGWVMRVIRN